MTEQEQRPEKEYVTWFVNREKQRRGFLMMLQGKTPKQIMMVKADAEMGKTWLIQRIHHDCSGRGVPVALIDFSRQAWDYLTIVRQVREQLGAAYFNYLTEVINEVTDVHVALRAEQVNIKVDIRDSQLEQSNVNVGEARLVTDNFGQFQQVSEDVRRGLELRITDAFLSCLQSLAQGQPVVFLVDTLDLAADRAKEWLTQHLLWSIREGRLPGVLLIMAGRTVIELDRQWNDWVAKTGLDLFNDEHVGDYMAKIGLQDRLSVSVEDLMKMTRGHPGLLGQVANNVLLDELVDEDEEWM